MMIRLLSTHSTNTDFKVQYRPAESTIVEPCLVYVVYVYIHQFFFLQQLEATLVLEDSPQSKDTTQD